MLWETLQSSGKPCKALISVFQSSFLCSYKENLLKLDKLVLIKFSEDSTVVPRGTEWFGFYKPGQAQEMLAYNETQLYLEDWIGLKSLDEDGKVDFLESEGDHLQFTDDFFFSIIDKYLKKKPELQEMLALLDNEI